MRTPSRILVLSALLSVAACGDLKVRYVPPPELVPQELVGEWRGQWQSSTTGNTGDVVLTIQEFDGEPVVAVSTDNPFVVPGEYELAVTAEGIVLRIEQEVVLQANVIDGEAQQLDGRFRWGVDEGTWSATWSRSLPELLDLGGVWQGQLLVVGADPLPLQVTLDQMASGGALQLSGLAEMPLLSGVLPLEGQVVFDESGFLLQLRTKDGFEPLLVLTGRGDREPLQVPLAALQVLTPSLPFSEGIVRLVKQP